MKHDPSERPNFPHIIAYLDKIGAKQSSNTIVSHHTDRSIQSSSRLISNLSDFLQ